MQTRNNCAGRLEKPRSERHLSQKSCILTFMQCFIFNSSSKLSIQLPEKLSTSAISYAVKVRHTKSSIISIGLVHKFHVLPFAVHVSIATKYLFTLQTYAPIQHFHMQLAFTQLLHNIIFMHVTVYL